MLKSELLVKIRVDYLSLNVGYVGVSMGNFSNKSSFMIHDFNPEISNLMSCLDKEMKCHFPILISNMRT